ncbi:WYL domain-containing protein [Phormidium sp. LEGE 05292]|uniref:helix-turn-helix transcriptional regulator n=1 Tax=[Phormidium] sp. LEGE 05292 TaxID=767427 RepID=UPI00187ED6EF|nr:WYL domain-containing protein [Phormidium sp. LEGE 05292]MBE9225412.1 WYL domain-containing protein [Phormidium sp. LEGE 05292]
MPLRTDCSYNQIAFTLEILKLLAEKPRKRDELANLLSEFLEQHGKPSEDVLQKLTRTIRQLRDSGFEIKSAPHHPYELVESNFPVLLSTEQRQALKMAADFLDGMGFSAQASQINRIGQLTQADRSNNVKVDFSPPVDYGENKLEAIIRQLQERFKQQCRYTIRYQNPKGEERTWDLDRSELRLHDGTLYLFAFVPDKPFPNIKKISNFDKNSLFRVDRIISVGAASNISWVFTFPTLKIRYRLSGQLASYRPRRSHEQVLYRDPQGKFVDILTEEDYLFWFRQRILRYGANAKVMEPDWLASELENEFKQAYLNYCQNSSEQTNC